MVVDGILAVARWLMGVGANLCDFLNEQLARVESTREDRRQALTLIRDSAQLARERVPS